jgi:hypothetical protein
MDWQWDSGNGVRFFNFSVTQSPNHLKHLAPCWEWASVGTLVGINSGEELHFFFGVVTLTGGWVHHAAFFGTAFCFFGICPSISATASIKGDRDFLLAPVWASTALILFWICGR